MNNLETFLKQESTENQFNELLTLSGLDTNGTLLLKFLIDGVEYDIYTSHHIMFNNIKHSPLGLIKKMHDDKGNVIRQWLPFKEEKEAGAEGYLPPGPLMKPLPMIPPISGPSIMPPILLPSSTKQKSDSVQMRGLGEGESTIYLGDDGYIYYPDVNTITDAEIVVDSIKNKGLILTKVKAVGGGGTGGGGVTPTLKLPSITKEMTTNDEEALVPTSRLAGFLKSPLVIGLVILGVGYVIYRFNTRKGKKGR